MTTTTKLNTTRARWYDLPVPATIGIVVFCLFLIAGLVGRLQQTPAAAAVPTAPLPIIIIASPLPVVPPTAVPAVQVAAVVPENVTQRAIGVFGGPDPATYIGSVEAGRAFTPIGYYRVDWIQVDMQGSGRVFVRTADLYGVPELANLEPTAVPVIVERPVYVVNQPAPAVATPEPNYAVVSHEQPTMQPQQAAIYDRQMWAQQAQAER